MLNSIALPLWSPDVADRTLPAQRTGSARASFMRHFQETLGCSAIDLLTDVRMSHAANELKKPTVTTEAVAEAVGYQSVSSFRRLFTERMGMTPGQWRRFARRWRALTSLVP